MPYDTTSMWNLKYTQMSLSTKQKLTHRHREQTCRRRGGELGRDGLGVWIRRHKLVIHIYIYPIYIYRMDEQQAPTIQHREIYSISCDNCHFAIQQKLTQHCI